MPAPQLEVSAWLARQKRAAAIDVSDGFGLDLARLCEASAVGVSVQQALLPVNRKLELLASWLGRNTHELALSGGEDYALLFALPRRVTPPAKLGCQRIGEITDDPRRWLIEEGGKRALEADGWDHLNARLD
jgi:thiamine-monophosphate kinase